MAPASRDEEYNWLLLFAYQVHKGQGSIADPYRIELEAAVDSKDVQNYPEDLDLCPWS